MSDTTTIETFEETKEIMLKRKDMLKGVLTKVKRELRKVEKLPLEDNPDKPDKIQKLEDEVRSISDEIIELDQDLKSLNRSAADEEDELTAVSLLEVAKKFIDCVPSAAYIIDDQCFTFIKDFSTTKEKQNVVMSSLEPVKMQEYLANKLNLKSWHLPIPRLKNLYNEKSRTFQLSRFSIDQDLWNNDEIYLPIKHMEQYFIDKHVVSNPPDEELDVIGMFDCLMHSLSGGKQENQEHVEKWILHKVINYRKAVSTPDIVIVGHVGGNGKGILQAIIRQMFPAVLSGKANSKTLSGNFNAIMLGKLIVFFDDQNSKEIPLEVVKQLAGSETMIFEPKGKDQYEGEKTHSSAWFSNTLPFPLTPSGQEGGVDRRFSIMRTNITFLESIREYYKTNKMLDISVEDSKDFAETIVSNILLNRECIALWFQHLCEKHPEVNKNYSLKPLHGEDYNYFLELQVTSLETIFKDLIIPVLNKGGCVPIFVIKELLRLLDSRDISDKTIVTKLREISAQNKIEIEIERTTITMHDNANKVPMKKQCTIIRNADIDVWVHKSFNWNLVSSETYLAAHENKDIWIPEDKLVFGMKSEKVEDEDHICTDDVNVFEFANYDCAEADE